MLSPNAIFIFVLSICFTWLMPVFWGWCQTYVSDSVITSDGTVVPGGAVALGKGSLHDNAFMTGDDIGPDNIIN